MYLASFSILEYKNKQIYENLIFQDEPKKINSKQNIYRPWCDSKVANKRLAKFK